VSSCDGGADLRMEAPGQAREVAMIDALDVAAATLVVETGRSKRRGDFRALPSRPGDLGGPC